MKSIGSGKDNGNVLAIAISAKRKLEKKHPGVDLAAEAQDVIDNVENYLASHPQCKTAGSVDLSLAGLCLDVVERAMKGHCLTPIETRQLTICKRLRSSSIPLEIWAQAVMRSQA